MALWPGEKSKKQPNCARPQQFRVEEPLENSRGQGWHTEGPSWKTTLHSLSLLQAQSLCQSLTLYTGQENPSSFFLWGLQIPDPAQSMHRTKTVLWSWGSQSVPDPQTSSGKTEKRKDCAGRTTSLFQWSPSVPPNSQPILEFLLLGCSSVLTWQCQILWDTEFPKRTDRDMLSLSGDTLNSFRTKPTSPTPFLNFPDHGECVHILTGTSAWLWFFCKSAKSGHSRGGEGLTQN